MIKLLENSNKILRFHIEKSILHYFFSNKNNKSFFLYLIFLELSNNNGFCFFRIKEILENSIFKIKSRATIYSYIKDLENNHLINANYDSKNHQWIIQINSLRHIKLFNEYKEKNNIDLNILSEKKIDDELVEHIISLEENGISTDDNAVDEMVQGELDSVLSKENEEITQDNQQENQKEILMTLDQKREMDFNGINNVIQKMFGKVANLKNKQILLVTPYKTIDIFDKLDENICYSIDILENIEKTSREFILDYSTNCKVISPIHQAFINADYEIKENNIKDKDSIYKTKQKHLNNINFLDSNLINSIDIVSISIINYNNLKELQEIDNLANKANKEVLFDLVPLTISTLDEMETDIALNNIRKDIDDPHFHLTKRHYTESIPNLNPTEKLAI